MGARRPVRELLQWSRQKMRLVWTKGDSEKGPDLVYH